MLDPYYRTVEGFYAIIQKEWCSFGHMLEMRMNRDSSSKESSPIFLQFLDSLYQLIRQHPTSFEYTSHFLAVFGQAAYSGYFLTFRGNNDKERIYTLRKIAPYEDMPLQEFQYSSVFLYMNLMLRSNAYASLLLNPLYQSPPPAASKVPV